MNELLIETYDKNLELVEIEESKQLPKGSLGVLKGICADYKDPTRNGRSYSKKLWERVFNDPRIQEGLETRTLFGELDHPSDRLESLTKEAAIVMTNYTFDDNAKKVMGEFHILDTPNGRILKSLVDYGSKPGISSRGRGEINEKDNTVVEDSYILGGFDVVTLPSVQSARPEYKLTTESLEVKNFKSSIEKEISEADFPELTKIEQVINYTTLPEKTSSALLEAIEQRKESFSNKTKDGTTITSDNKLQGDLETAYKKIEKLEEEMKVKKVEVDQLKSSVGACKITEEDDDNISEEDWTADAIGNEEILEELLSLREEVNSNAEYKVDLESLQNILTQKEMDLTVLRDEKSALIETVDHHHGRLSELEIKLGTLKENYNIITLEHESLKEDFVDSEITTKTISKLETELFKAKDTLESLENENKSLKEQFSGATKNSSKLEKKYLKLQESFDNFADAYVELRTKQAGLAEKTVNTLLPENFTVDDVENVISGLYEEQSRLSNLPFNDELISLKEVKTDRQDYGNAKQMLGTFKKQKTGGNK